MIILPQDILKIILNYKDQFELHDKYKKCLYEINELKYISIYFCQFCRNIILNSNIHNIEHECNHVHFLSKHLYLNKYNSYILKYNPFTFFCSICNKYDNFFIHLFHN